jgi:hypothetical protein
MEIYRRLLEKDPDNDKIRQRLIHIEAAAAREPGTLPEAGVRENSIPRKPVERPKKTMVLLHRRRRIRDERPLKGVRIKKKVKEKLRAGRKGL